MRAGSPLLSAARRSSRSSRSRRSPLRGFKSPAASEAGPQVPVLRLRDINMYYRLLRRLVPGLPPGRAASRVEILQHVIDYILQLQTELDAPGSATGDPLYQDRPQSGQSSGTDTHTCQVNMEYFY
uniref:DNA-binding protein inhibitor ID-3-like n=1 Tax=Sparus aurata TaxID=8175 RepID=A0A671TXW8_SPAAU